jgi:centrosomal protein CEP290
MSKEKHSLRAKLQTAISQIAEKDSPENKLTDPDATRKLHLECEALHRELASTRRVVDVEQAGEIARLQRKVFEFEAAQGSGTLRLPEKSILETRVRVLEADVLARDDDALGLKFEAEQAVSRADRLQRRLNELFNGGGTTGASSSRDGSSRRALELEDVVDALKKVVEKQQGELSAARARLATVSRAGDASNLAKQLKQKVDDLELEAVASRRVETERNELLRKTKDLERKLAGKTGRSDQTLSLVQQAQTEAADTALALAETRDALAASENALDAARQDAQRARRVANAGNASGGSSESRVETLLAENADLRAELESLDPEFFDEVMEMKRSFHDQQLVVARYENLLRRYAGRLGETFEPATK